MAGIKRKTYKSPLEISPKRTPVRKRITKTTVKKTTRKLVVPTEENNFRPFLQRTSAIIAVLAIVITAQFIHSNFISGRVLGNNPKIAAEQLLVATNEQRAHEGSSTLTISASLSAAALEKANDMFANQYWSHDSPTGVTPWKWIADQGYTYVKAGENLARGFNNTGSIITAWMNSPKHRENVMNPAYTEVGFAVVDGRMDGKPTTIVVAMYAQPSVAAVPVPPMVLGEVEEESSIFQRIYRGITSAAPALIFTLSIIGIVFLITSLAHTKRKKLPKELRDTWYRHHAIIKSVFLGILTLTAIMSYGSGLI